MGSSDLLERVMFLVPLLLSLSVHEWAHAWSAYKLGDDTASMQGRLTLNPVAHIDIFGTLILPLLGIPFGWAKPVPVNPARFRRDISMSTGMMITAAAGPISNVVLAVLSAVALGLLYRFHVLDPFREMQPRAEAVSKLLEIMIGMNITLALFNLLPVPPLDGSRVAEGLVPYRYRGYWDAYARYARYGLIIVFFAAARILPIDSAMSAIGRLIWFVAGRG